MSSSIVEDEPLELSVETFNALQEFYSEQARREELEKGKFDEDWQLSQFWYDEPTADRLARECARSDGAKVACISCPTTYSALIRLFPEKREQFYLFEYDKRFESAAGTNFRLYDYKFPLNFPKEWRKYFDVVIADPPFLSEECLTKTAVTIKYLAKDKIIVCTGSKMEDLCERLLGLKRREFAPKHNNNLANEFACFSNYEDIDDFLNNKAI